MTLILVVDDNANDVDHLTAVLEGDGFRVATAFNGRDALETARRERPDLIVSDLLMPALDGSSLLRQVRHDPQLALVPFVVYSATCTDPEDEQLALDLGATAFLVKPSEPDVLLRKIRAALRATVRPALDPSRREGALETSHDHSQALVHTLERKLLQFEQANRRLQWESNERRQLAATRAAVLDALPAHIALLDGTGTVVSVNEAWRRFASANAFGNDDFGVGLRTFARADVHLRAHQPDRLTAVVPRHDASTYEQPHPVAVRVAHPELLVETGAVTAPVGIKRLLRRDRIVRVHQLAIGFA